MSASVLSWPARHLAPRAHALDTDPHALTAALDDAARAGLLGLRAPTAAGGRALSPVDYTRWTIEVARASGTFAFLQVQHQSAVGFLTAADGPVRRHLPALASGTTRCGISYGWLRRPGPPAVTATTGPTGLHLQGRVPWFTGHGFFTHCVSAARLPDDRTALVFHRIDTPATRASAPMATAVFEAARTVTLDLDLHVPREDVLAIVSADWLARRDPTKVVGQGALILGTAWAALDLIAHAVTSGRVPHLAPSLDRARQRLQGLHDRFLHAIDHPPDDGLDLRTTCIELAGRFAHAAVAAWSGSSASQTHPAQRVYREVLGFSVLSQTAAVRDASVERLLDG